MSEGLEIANPSASKWEEMLGLFDKSTEVTVVERVYKEILHKRKKYRLKPEFALSEKQVMIAAPSPTKPVPGAEYSIDFTMSMMVDKGLVPATVRVDRELGLHLGCLSA